MSERGRRQIILTRKTEIRSLTGATEIFPQIRTFAAVVTRIRIALISARTSDLNALHFYRQTVRLLRNYPLGVNDDVFDAAYEN